MRAVFLDFGTVSHDDLDTAHLERVLPGITLFPASTEAEDPTGTRCAAASTGKVFEHDHRKI
jgi:hypothetical protein